jgi:HEAT repeat protein
MAMTTKKKTKSTTSKTISEAKGKKPEKMDTPLKTLIVDLGSYDDVVRVKARHSLVAMGKAAVPSLTEALKNKKYLMRWEAAKALGEIGNPAAAPNLVEALEDEEFDVRWLAAIGLIGMSIKGLKPLLHALMERGDSVLLQEGAHHVIHDLAKGGLRRYLAPVLASLEGVEQAMVVPNVAFKALEMLKEDKRL